MRKLIKENSSAAKNLITTKIKNTPHESAVRQVSGSARYVDDIPVPANLCHAAVGLSDVASGTIAHIDFSKVLASEGVIDLIVAEDVPGHIDIGPVFKGDPVLVKRITIQNQGIINLPENLSDFTKVKLLDLSHNNIQHIDFKFFSKFNELEKLYINSNSISEKEINELKTQLANIQIFSDEDVKN